MKKQFILVHIEGGIPSFWTNDPSILIVLHDRDAKGTESWETYEQNDPVFDKMMMMPETVDGITVSPIEAKQLLDTPAIEENGEKQPDWQKETESMVQKAKEAIEYVNRIAIEGPVRVEFTTSGYVYSDSIQWNSHALMLCRGEDIAFYPENLSHYDKMRLAATVQKAIAERNPQP